MGIFTLILKLTVLKNDCRFYYFLLFKSYLLFDTALGINLFQQYGLEKGIWKPSQDHNLTAVRVQREKNVSIPLFCQRTFNL